MRKQFKTNLILSVSFFLLMQTVYLYSQDEEKPRVKESEAEAFVPVDDYTLDHSFTLKGAFDVSKNCELIVRQNLAGTRMQFLELPSRKNKAERHLTVNDLNTDEAQFASLAVSSLIQNAELIENIIVLNESNKPIIHIIYQTSENKLSEKKVNLYQVLKSYRNLSAQERSSDSRVCMGFLQ